MIRHTAYAFLFMVIFLFVVAGLQDELEQAEAQTWSQA